MSPKADNTGLIGSRASLLSRPQPFAGQQTITSGNDHVSSLHQPDSLVRVSTPLRGQALHSDDVAGGTRYEEVTPPRSPVTQHSIQVLLLA